MNITAVIPVRLNSTRLPEKALADLEGKPLIQRVWERVIDIGIFDEVIIATDHRKILDRAKDFGAEARMTSDGHGSGTERVAEVAESLDSDVVVNIQGDEPFVTDGMIETLIEPFVDETTLMTTLKTAIKDNRELGDPNVVKVVCDKMNNAIYFSRCSVPYSRNGGGDITRYKHIGLYAYRRKFLKTFSSMEATPLERAESLEQLRVLENGFRIRVMETPEESLGIDTPEQLETAREIIRGT